MIEESDRRKCDRRYAALHISMCPDNGNDTVSGDASLQSEYASVFRLADKCSLAQETPAQTENDMGLRPSGS